MKKLIVKTGYGYFKDKEGHIIAKANLPIGTHPLKDDYTYEEVSSKKGLDNINIYISPLEEQKKKKESLIQNKLREIAIAALQKEGKL